jgi:hypothetical protein
MSLGLLSYRGELVGQQEVIWRLEEADGAKRRLS